MVVYGSTFQVLSHGAVVRNRLAVRIAGSHPADRGSIPRYGSNHYGLQPKCGRLEIPAPKIFFSQHTFYLYYCLDCLLLLFASASAGSFSHGRLESCLGLVMS